MNHQRITALPKADLDEMMAELVKLRFETASQAAEIKQLREALEVFANNKHPGIDGFYAWSDPEDQENPGADWMWIHPKINDPAEFAREALKS